MESESRTLPCPSLYKNLKGHKNGVTALSYNPNELQLASGSLDSSVLIWDLQGNMRSYRFTGHEEAVTDVAFTPSGKHMASASRDRTVRLWVPTVTGSTGMIKAHSQTVRSVQFSPGGDKILTASDDKVVKLWSFHRFKFISSFTGHTNWVRCARMSADGSVIASCSDDKTVRLWNPESGELIYTYKDEKTHGLNLAWHPSGCYIAIGSANGNVKLYDIRTHNLVQYYSVHNEAVNQVSFHPSGSYILTACKDGQMKILDLLEGHPLFTMTSHDGPVNAVSFSPGGGGFASAGHDKVVNLWKTNFTELDTDMKENIAQNTCSKLKTGSQSQTSRVKYQGARPWYLCYHTDRYPVITFVHLDDDQQSSNDTRESQSFPRRVSQTPRRLSFSNPPNANSTLANGSLNTSRRETFNTSGSDDPSLERTASTRATLNTRSSSPFVRSHDYSHSNCDNVECVSADCNCSNIGHMSHIPRVPPKPSTYTVPSMTSAMDNSLQQARDGNDIFGMVKLKENDVCYTNGTIEWVGRKRGYPINSGFKILDKAIPLKRAKESTRLGVDLKDCDCADVLPTVNAIVDHLNALHEAVDIVDLRLNTLEDVMSRTD